VVNFESPIPETSGTSEVENEEPQQVTEPQQEAEEQAPRRRSRRKPKKPDSTQQTANGEPSKALQKPPGGRSAAVGGWVLTREIRGVARSEH